MSIYGAIGEGRREANIIQIIFNPVDKIIVYK